MSQLRYHTVQCSKIITAYHIKTSDKLKHSWGSYSATGSEITEKEQHLCNTHLNRNYFNMITSFHQPGTGR